MVWTQVTGRVWVVVVSSILVAIPALAHDEPQSQFERAYFLQTHEHDYPGAAAAFKAVVGSAEAPEALRAEAKRRLAQCEEEAVASDLARLMPPEALAYVEIDRPGQHVARILRMIGLLREPSARATDSLPQGIPLGEGMFFPEDFSISPALVEELGKLKGMAAALTAFDERRGPSGVAVLHLGDFNLLRGEIETAVQFLQPDQPIEGCKTYQVEGMAWITLTSRLVIVSDTREGVAATVARLRDPDARSLAAVENFQRCQAAREDALLFAYLNGPEMMRHFGSELPGREVAMARAVLDLDHLESFTAAVGTTENSIQARASLNLSPGHKNLVYAMVRTAPLTGRSLEYVPQGVAGLVLLGLNPAGGQPVAVAGDPSFAAMDLGREVFGNLEEVALFVLPPERAGAGPPIPEIGLVMAVNDAAKSEALWTRLLSLPALFGLPGAPAPREVTIEGQAAKVYAFPDAPPIALVRLGDRVLVAGTQPAVAAAVRADAANQGIRQDASFQPLLGRLEPTTSKAVLLDPARIVQAAAGAGFGSRHAEEVSMVASLLRGLKVSAVTEEGPTQLTVRIEATGLPNVPRLLKAMGPVMMEHERAMRDAMRTRVRSEQALLEAQRQALDAQRRAAQRRGAEPHPPGAIRADTASESPSDEPQAPRP